MALPYEVVCEYRGRKAEPAGDTAVDEMNDGAFVDSPARCRARNNLLDDARGGVRDEARVRRCAKLVVDDTQLFALSGQP